MDLGSKTSRNLTIYSYRMIIQTHIDIHRSLKSNLDLIFSTLALRSK